ncbi:MAG: hypothetical protein IJ775_03495 [Muribaculaceae bacterium]|nr:hypothetical protein [Muribaculaceae bacterium]
MDIAIYPLTSPLHDQTAVDVSTHQFLDSLGLSQSELVQNGFADFGSHSLDLIYVRTGGTEGIFKELLPQLARLTRRPFYLLTSGKSNSLAASLEILSYLRNNGLRGEILHGTPDSVSRRITLLAQAGAARKKLDGCRLGVIGKPSDWLIASGANRIIIKQQLGIEFVDITMDELIGEIGRSQADNIPEEWTSKAPNKNIKESLKGTYGIYLALKEIINKYKLTGFTIRCFDLLSSVQNTGCLALAKLNAEGFVAGCEGDIPALLSMTIAHALLGVSGFQANPAMLNPESGEMLFAHCTIPLNMVGRYELDTHFESGIGVGVRGFMQEGPITIFKVAGDLSRHYAEEGMLSRSQSKPDLCRTQQILQLRDREKINYFLTCPIGNHHIILPSHCKALLDEILC